MNTAVEVEGCFPETTTPFVRTIARQVGIDTTYALTGPELEAMDQADKQEAVKRTTVFLQAHSASENRDHHPVAGTAEHGRIPGRRYQ